MRCQHPYWEDYQTRDRIRAEDEARAFVSRSEVDRLSLLGRRVLVCGALAARADRSECVSALV